jgi:DNA invertase Pin-like site-specific DNA recombinase
VRVFSYLRYSRGHQRKGRSEKRQTTTAADYCARRGWELDNTLYADRGVSGFKGAHAATGQLGAFLKDITAGKVKPGDVLIVESLDRLSRQDIDDAFDLFRGILRAGVEIVTLDPERHYTRDSLKQITGIIEPLVIMARANEESERKSSRGKDVWALRRSQAEEQKKPTNGACPKWVRYDKAAKKFLPIPERVAVVKRIFVMCIEGKGCRQIAATLNREGVPPFARLWEISAVGRLLRSRSVMGEYQPKVRGETGRVAAGAAVPDYYPQIIDPETFWRAQGMLDGRNVLKVRGREGKGVANLFTGLLWDASDGSPMQYKNTTAGKYLNSENAHNGITKGNGFKYPIFEESVLMFLKGYISLESEDKTAHTKEREALQAKLSACEARLKRTQATMATADDPDVYAAMAEVLAQQTRQRKALQLSLDRAKAEEQANPRGELKATKSVILAYYEALEREEKLGGMLDALKKATGKKHTPETKALEAKIRAEHWGDFRAQIKNKLRALITEIWVLVRAEGWRSKTALVEIHFKDGSVKALAIHVDPAGDITNMPIKSLDLKHWSKRKTETS